MKRILQAAWIAPMDRSGPALVRDGGVAIDGGRILAVDGAQRLQRRFPDAVVEQLGDVILLPGLVNAHVHLELSDHSCGPLPEGGLAAWLFAMPQRAALEPPHLAAKVQEAVALGIEQCLRFGVTTVGDICRVCQAARPILADSPLRVTSYGEILAMAQNRELLEERLTAALAGEYASHLRIGLTPHAPYTVEPDGYRRCLTIARQRQLPLTTHLAESPDEAEFLAHHTGPLRRIWDRKGRWDDSVPYFDGGPIRLAKTLGLLDFPTLLAHVNYCDDSELALLAAGRASVVWCPRTHDYFAHPPHRWRDMLAAGINVAIGTDSCASSPDLNLVDDLRRIHQQWPEVDHQEIWALATWRGAAALGTPDVGSLSPMKFADLVAFPALGPDPLQSILQQNVFPTALWIDGRKMADKLQ